MSTTSINKQCEEICKRIMAHDYAKQELVKELKALWIKTKRLTLDDKYGDVYEGKGRRIQSVRKLLHENLALGLCTVPKDGNPWAEFDVYKNYDSLLATVHSTQEQSLKDLKQKINRRLRELRDEVINLMEFKGKEAYITEKEEKKDEKKQLKIVTKEQFAKGKTIGYFFFCFF